MPDNILIASFVFGAVLLFLALVGGNFRLFSAEFSGTAGAPIRILAGLLGILLIYFGLLNPVSSIKDDQMNEESNNLNSGINLSDTSTSSPVQSQIKSINIPKSLEGTWIGSIALLVDRNDPMFMVRLVVDPNGKINLYKSYIKDATNLDEPPRIITEGWLSKDKGLHFKFVNPGDAISTIDGELIEFLSKDLINVEGIAAVDTRKEDTPLSERVFQTPAIIKLERQPALLP